MPKYNFKDKWGISANELAEAEGVTPEAIRMRVRNFGSPWQRSGKPSKFEKKYGKTLKEIAIEEGVHPVTIANRENKYGDAYHKTYTTRGNRMGIGNIGSYKDLHWSENPLSGFSGAFRARPQFVKGYEDEHKRKPKPGS